MYNKKVDSNWETVFFKEPSQDQIESFFQLDEELTSYFRVTRNQLIEERLKSVVSDHSLDAKKDSVDEIV